MSRHRAIRNLDLDEELADDYDDFEEPWAQASTSDLDSLDSALEQVKSVLGNEASSGFTDRTIKEALWDAYFDSQVVISQLLEDKERREAKEKRKAEDPTAMNHDEALKFSLHALSLHPSGARRARGIAGLATRGRSGLAKRNLASLAPEGLPGVAHGQGVARGAPVPAQAQAGGKLALLAAQRRAVKRPAEAEAAGPSGAQASMSGTGASATAVAAVGTLRPSKLAALAAARSRPSSGLPAPVPSPTRNDVVPVKPLSKLQLRAQASLAARQAQAAVARSGGASIAQADDKAMHVDPVELARQAEEAQGRQLLPGGIEARVLFPSRLTGNIARADPSPFADVLLGSVRCAKAKVGAAEQASIPGGNPFEPVGGERATMLRRVFEKPSPDDVVLKAREGTNLRAGSKPASGTATPTRGTAVKSAGAAAAASTTSSGAALGLRKAAAAGASTETNEVLGLRANVERLNIAGGSNRASEGSSSVPGTPKLSATVLAHDKVRDEWRKAEEMLGGRKGISLVVVGHVDAGKSTLMGRLLRELGTLSDKEHTSNERASAKIGKGSFAYAWALDSSEEERERGVTIDVAHDAFRTPHRRFTLLDAPGHRDFIPNMISGAAQADAALLVVDASKGAFEAGFGPNGQTREHAILVRSLGVQQLVIVVNKLDAVNYDQERFEEITNAVKPFLAQSGFEPSKLSFVPCGAAVGENLSERTGTGLLSAWYSGPRLVDVLDELEPPRRQIDTPLRMPVTNVFRGQTAISSGIGASGRVVGGVITVGDKVRIVPGDETAIVRAIEQDGETVPWAVAGSAITAYLAGIDMVFINIGSVLCAPTSPVAMVSTIVARILVFEPSHPLLAGTSLELFHHSSNLSATLVELVATLDSKTGAEPKRKPRVLGKGVTATVRIALTAPVAMEPFAQNRDMGRVVLRMRGESVAAGIVLECS